MAELTNDFTWSKSRHEKFKQCPRAYWLTYYGSWGGWDAASGSAVRELYVLKRLSSRWQWAGSVVHSALERVLLAARAGRPFPAADDLVRRTRDRARAEWVGSREKSYWREPKRAVGLVEHEYGDPVANEEWKGLWDQVIEGSLRSFLASDTLARIQRIPREHWLTVDELDHFVFEGTKVWVAVDFAYRDPEGRVHLLDWKTGRERDVDHVQLGIYALYAQQKWGVSPEQVVGGLVYLQSGGDRVNVQVDSAALDQCRETMRCSIAGMKARLDDADRNLASCDQFPLHDSRDGCRHCPFRRPCGRM
ncbi:MAG TPA: PD-(D/E)XK nuclease family protein [Anaeromyxobacteraceae bacterium]|nr:PD-(D/E)XK nuclease family protein [Anaeromyxobacteraceae bacterium]